MFYGRYSHGCIVVDSTLWVMGTVPQIETFDLSDVDNGMWSLKNDELSIADRLIDIGVVAVNHYIYVAGGWIGDYQSVGGYSSPNVYIIDTKSESMATDKLPYSVSALAMIAIDDTIYGFGGYKASGTWKSRKIKNTWISYEQFSTCNVFRTLSRIIDDKSTCTFLRSVDRSDSSEGKTSGLEEDIPLFVLGVVILMIIIMGCIVLYLLIRRKRMRGHLIGTNIRTESNDIPYVSLSDGDDVERRAMDPGGNVFGDDNIAESQFKRDRTRDSLYENEDMEGLVKDENTKNEEGSGSVTKMNGD